jgi:magnesium transporter
MSVPATAESVIDLLVGAYLDRHPAEVARELSHATEHEIAALLGSEPGDRSLEVLRRLTPTVATEALAAMEPAVAGRFLSHLDPNRAAALLASLGTSERDACLSNVEPAAAAELRQLMSYPADSAGHLMDPRVATFHTNERVRDVVSRLRQARRRRVQDIFLVDEEDHLLGSMSLEDLVLASPDDRLDELAQWDTPSVSALATREEIIETLDSRRTRSLPVVDFEGRVLGVLRQRELIETAQSETAGNLATMVGAGRDERALSSPLLAVRKRLPWLQINLVTAFLAAAVVSMFEGVIAQYTALAILLPVVAGQSGNTGAQALAVTMRGLALREVRVRQWGRVAAKELAAGAMNGVAVAFTTGVAVYVWSRSTGLALVIVLSMILSMSAAGLAGATIPMVLTRLGQDPAQSSSIVLTTVTDVVGFMSFLGIATLLVSTL